ncbi:MAG TPA: tetratricopeptide repeat protein [Pirellulales bacterium]|jgi:tetratricopeptide (TPR) repeat protein|nr:tetratricopeptide repeat protein [Pirellulales bacterium]
MTQAANKSYAPVGSPREISMSRNRKSVIQILCGTAIIIFSTILIYWPALHGEFVMDDALLVTHNPIVKSADGLYRFWCTTEPTDYWPLTNSTFWLEWRLWGMNSAGYHVTNLVLHIASVLLLWAILRKLSIPGAWLAALLFAVHPVNVESIAWIAQRKNALAMLFFLLSIFAYLQIDCSPALAASEPGPRKSLIRLFVSRKLHWYCFSWLAFILAMLSKGSVAVLPLVLLLIAWWQRQAITRWDIIRTAPFFLSAMLLIAVNLWFQTHGSGEIYRPAGFAERLAGAGAVIWFYLFKAVLPTNLIFVYPQWNIQIEKFYWWLPLIAVAALTGMLVWQRNHSWGKPLLFAWAFFCVALLPVMGFVDVSYMQYSLVADHYQYLALIAVMTLAAAFWSRWYQRAHQTLRWVAISAAAFVAGMFGYLAWQQSRTFGSCIELYQTTIDKNSRCWVAYNNLGVKLQQQGNIQEAINDFRQAIVIKPVYASAYNNLASALIDAGQPSEAIEPLEQALQLKPDYMEAGINLGMAQIKTGHSQDAVDTLRQVVQQHSNSAEAHANLGIALKKVGQVSEAIQQYEQVLTLSSDSTTLFAARFNLAIALVEIGRTQEAIDNYQLLIAQKPSYAQSYYSLAVVYSQLGQTAEVSAAAQRALELARSQGNTILVQQIENWLMSH